MKRNALVRYFVHNPLWHRVSVWKCYIPLHICLFCSLFFTKTSRTRYAIGHLYWPMCSMNQFSCWV